MDGLLAQCNTTVIFVMKMGVWKKKESEESDEVREIINIKNSMLNFGSEFDISRRSWLK